MGKTYITDFHGTDLVICSHSIEGKIPSYSLINTVVPFYVMLIRLYLKSRIDQQALPFLLLFYFTRQKCFKMLVSIMQ